MCGKTVDLKMSLKEYIYLQDGIEVKVIVLNE